VTNRRLTIERLAELLQQLVALRYRDEFDTRLGIAPGI
jgi:hypothetical protein